MKIKIKENQYKTLTEAVGVPTNIVNIARKVYDNMMSKINSSTDIENFLKKGITLKDDFQINDHRFSKVNVKFNLENLDDYNLKDKNTKLIVLGMTHRGTVEMAKNFDYVSTTERDKVKLFVNLAVNRQTTMEDLTKEFTNDRVTLVYSLAHELKHAYDDAMNINVKTPERVTYQIGSQRSFGNIEPLNEFLRYMYFAHTTENLVRATELQATLEELDISREDFYKFITNNKTYSTYRDGIHFTYESLREKLLKVIPEIKETFDDNKIRYPENGDDEEIVDFTLHEFYTTLINWKGGIMNTLLTNDFLEAFMGFQGKKKKYFEKYINSINRFGDDYEKFFRYETKQINNICLKMTKKLSKLYSLIKDKNPQH